VRPRPKLGDGIYYGLDQIRVRLWNLIQMPLCKKFVTFSSTNTTWILSVASETLSTCLSRLAEHRVVDVMDDTYSA